MAQRRETRDDLPIHTVVALIRIRMHDDAEPDEDVGQNGFVDSRDQIRVLPRKNGRLECHAYSSPTPIIATKVGRRMYTRKHHSSPVKLALLMYTWMVDGLYCDDRSIAEVD